MGSVFAALPSTNARVSPVFQGRNCTLAANTGETRSAMKVFDVELIRQKGRSRLSDTYFCIWPKAEDLADYSIGLLLTRSRQEVLRKGPRINATTNGSASTNALKEARVEATTGDPFLDS